jgi:hypothetical protein
MKAYGVNEFGHGHERRANTFRNSAKRQSLKIIDHKRQRNIDKKNIQDDCLVCADEWKTPCRVGHCAEKERS